MALITDARQGMWNAIHNWAPLKASGGDSKATRFKRWFDGDADAPMKRGIFPSFSEMPCIAIHGVGLQLDWQNNRQMRWPILFVVKIWTPTWKLGVSEDLFEEVVKALYLSKNVSNVEYVRAATGFPVMAWGETEWKHVEEDGQKAIECEFKVGLRTTFDPYAEG